MDTRFWGPSGWKMLHQITFNYDPKQQKAKIKEMFTTLPYVLPCKFCRASLTTYMRTDPVEPALESRAALSKWLYRIHNCVNDKLRKQGQTIETDPTFESVKAFYEDLLASGCSKTDFPGWEFLFSVAENHPLCRESKKSSPIPDAPERKPGMSDEDLNEWNLFQPEERVPYYTRFWTAIGACLPYPEWRQLWKRACVRTKLIQATRNRMSLLKSLWKVRCTLEKEFELVGRTRFADLCLRLAEHRSGCAKSRRAITCRKNKTRKLR